MHHPHETPSVAIYWDFENLHAALCEAAQEGFYARPDSRFKVQDPLVDVQAVVDVAASFGAIAINRAYCNWQYFGRYRDALLQNAIELVQLFPPGATAKNGADIRLCLDAVEDVVRLPHIRTVVVVGGDSDFMPLAHRLKAAGKTLVGIGALRTTNRHWARSCNEFRYYERLVEAAGRPYQPNGTPAPQAERQPDGAAQDLVQRAARLLRDTQGADAAADGPTLERMVRRLDPTFEPAQHGYPDFSAMLHALARQRLQA